MKKNYALYILLISIFGLLIITVLLLFNISASQKIEKIEDVQTPITQQLPSSVTIRTTEKEGKASSTVQEYTEEYAEELADAEYALFELKKQKENNPSQEEKETIENEINRWIDALQQIDDTEARNLLLQFETLQNDVQDSIQETPETTPEETDEITSEETQEYTEEEILIIIEQIAEQYDVPSWFLKAIVRRESSFNNTDISYDDGIEGNDNWNEARPECSFTIDDYPHGLGLTKLTGWMYQGSPYPFCLETQDNNYDDYYYAMRMQDYGNWIDMNSVTELIDPFDPEQNLERFLTGYAIPAYNLFATQYPDESEEEIWRRVAFHWNKGLYREYDVNNTDYLELYDVYVEIYQNDYTQ